MAEDWDLYAVVRSCKSATNTATATASGIVDDTSDPFNSCCATCAMEEEQEQEEDPLACLASLKFEEENDGPFCFPDLGFESRNNAFQELEQLYKPFFSNPTTTPTITTSTSLGIIPDSSIPEFGGCSSGQQQHHHHRDNNLLMNSNATIRDHQGLIPATSLSIGQSQTQTPRSRKR